MKLTGSLTLVIKEKPMESRTQSYWIHAIYTGLILVLLLPALTDAKQASLSPAMKSLLGQANSMYLSRFGTNVDKLVNENPMTLASILGVTLQRQTNYAVKNSHYMNQYWKLRAECEQLLEFIARQKGYKNPKDGSRMTADNLKGEFFEGISGAPNNFFIEKFGFDPATVNLPMILAQVGPENQGGGYEEMPSLPVRQDKPDGIVIGGERAGAAETTVEGQYNPRPLDINPQPQQQLQRQKIGRGAIIGTWQFASADCYSEIPDNDSGIIRFSRGSGNALYQGRSQDGKHVYTIISENQIDAYRIEYKGYWKDFTKQNNISWFGCEPNRLLTYVVSRTKKNNLMLCRPNCGRIVAAGFVKVGN